MSISEAQTPKAHRLPILYRFFGWCSGARIYLLKHCPTDYNKYFGIGIIIFLTGVMAAISGGYALYTVFGSMPLAAGFGLFWGTVIFFLDWYLVGSMRKEGRPRKELLAALPRLVLAVFLAVIISKPLELKLFEKEIDKQIELEKRNSSLAIRGIVDEEYQDRELLKTENAKLWTEISEKEAKRNELFEMIVAEAEGRSLTGQVGKGPVYREKKAQMDKIDCELAELKERNLARIEANDKKIAELEAKHSDQMEQSARANENYDGLLARIEALGALGDQNTSIMLAGWFILLLFVTIESAPMLVKLISQRGPYDELLEAEELRSKMETKQLIFDINARTKNYLSIASEREKQVLEQHLKLNDRMLAEMEKARGEVNLKTVQAWRRHELKKVDEETEKTLKKLDNITGEKYRGLN